MDILKSKEFWIREALTAAGYPQWVRGTTSGFNVSGGDTEVYVKWHRGPGAGGTYTSEAERADVEMLAACGRALLAAGFDVYYAAATHGNRMLIIPKTPAPRRGLARVPGNFTAYDIFLGRDGRWHTSPGPLARERSAAVPPGDPDVQQAMRLLGEAIGEAERNILSGAERERAGALASLRAALAGARDLGGPAGDFSAALLEVLSVVLAWQDAAAAIRDPRAHAQMISVGDATDQVLAAIKRGLAL